MRNQTFLQLAPEFGGTKFGPFDQGEVRLGSDPSNSDITLPATLPAGSYLIVIESAKGKMGVKVGKV